MKEKKSRRFYLVVISANKRIDLKALGSKLNNKIKFANAEDLKKILDLEPGSVSPFGLINDKEHIVKVIIDRDIWDAELVNFHPNINTETVELTKEGFRKYIKSLDNSYIIEVM